MATKKKIIPPTRMMPRTMLSMMLPFLCRPPRLRALPRAGFSFAGAARILLAMDLDYLPGAVLLLAVILAVLWLGRPRK